MKPGITLLIMLLLEIFSGCSPKETSTTQFFDQEFLTFCAELGINTQEQSTIAVFPNTDCVACNRSVYQRIEKSRIDKNSSPIILLLPEEFNSKEEKSKLSNCDQVSSPKISDCFEYSLEDMRRYGLVHSFGVWVEIQNGEIIFQEGIFLD